jgi:hypothetical protein
VPAVRAGAGPKRPEFPAMVCTHRAHPPSTAFFHVFARIGCSPNPSRPFPPPLHCPWCPGSPCGYRVCMWCWYVSCTPVLPSCTPGTHPQLTIQPSFLLPTSLCRHHIRENLNGLCPACRTPYNADPHAFSAVDRQECVSSLFPPCHETVTHLNSPTRYNPHIGVSTES